MLWYSNQNYQQLTAIGFVISFGKFAQHRCELVLQFFILRKKWIYLY